MKSLSNRVHFRPCKYQFTDRRSFSLSGFITNNCSDMASQQAARPGDGGDTWPKLDFLAETSFSSSDIWRGQFSSLTSLIPTCVNLDGLLQPISVDRQEGLVILVVGLGRPYQLPGMLHCYQSSINVLCVVQYWIREAVTGIVL